MTVSNSQDDEQPVKKSPIEIASDDDWKTRVKADDARLDSEQAVQNSQKAAPADSDDSAGVPPDASFFTLVQMFSMQAVVAMGLIPGPDGQARVELPIAKHFVDLLGMIEKKTEGNLNPQEKLFLNGTLHELRMSYIEASKKR